MLKRVKIIQSDSKLLQEKLESIPLEKRAQFFQDFMRLVEDYTKEVK